MLLPVFVAVGRSILYFLCKVVIKLELCRRKIKCKKTKNLTVNTGWFAVNGHGNLEYLLFRIDSLKSKFVEELKLF